MLDSPVDFLIWMLMAWSFSHLLRYLLVLLPTAQEARRIHDVGQAQDAAFDEDAQRDVETLVA